MSSLAVDQRKTFAELSEICERILTADRKDKRDILAEYIIDWKRDEGYNSSKPETSFFPCLRLLCPWLDRSRPAFGLKEFTLGKEYCKLLGLNKESKEGQMIMNYKNPKYAKVDGDLSNVIKRIMLKRSRVDKSNLTIRDINDALDRIALGNKENDPSRVDSALEYLIKNLGPLENKWIIRIILKNLNFGLSETVIMNTFHPDAKSFYDCSHDLAEVCVKLADARIRGFEIKLTLFKPFGPMLAERTEIKKIETVMLGKPFCIEEKYDGERITLHKSGDCFKYFSRNGFDYSNSFNQSFTPYIGTCFEKMNDCILDGEMMGYNELNGTMITKSKLDFDVKKMDANDPEAFHPIYFVFDILLLNGNHLTNKPLKERVKLQEEFLKPKENWIQIANRSEGKSKNDATKCLNEAIEANKEGLIIKAWDSVYKPNVRKGSDWYKLKPDYVEGLMDDLDLLIVGGYYGDGRRAGIISQFLLAVAVSNNGDDNMQGRRFRSVGRVGSGYTDVALAQLLRKLEPYWVKYNPDNPPEFLELAKTKPEYYIEPENSYILQVKGSEFMETDDFATGVTLRFPRVVTIRYDKSWRDCMTTDELNQLKDHGSLIKGQVGYDSDQDEPIKRRRRPASDKTLAPHLQIIDFDSIDLQRNLFHGKEICVLNGSEEYQKSSIERLITQFGGKITANPTKETYCLIAHSFNDLRVKNLIKSNNYNIIKLSWFIKIVAKKVFISPKYHDYIAMTEETKERLKKYFDCYGDSYFVDITSQELSALLETVDQVDNSDLKESKELTSLFSQTFPLHSYQVYIPNSERDDFNNKMARYSLSFYGAKISNQLNSSTHQLIYKENKMILESCKSSEPNFIFDSSKHQWLKQH